MKFEAILRGVNFRPIEAKSLVLAMDQGHVLTLQREPDNQYDPNAIQVIDPETQIFIGFVAKEVAADIAPLMDEGTMFNCRAAERMGQLTFALDIWSEDEGDWPVEETQVEDEQSRGEE
jgi:hypothetical protein